MANKVTSIDDFIRVIYPELTKDQFDYNFFKAWGYEQWLIMRYKHDLEQLRILHSGKYAQYRLAEMLDGGGVDTFVGHKLVRSKKILRRALLQTVPKDFPGILMWADEKGHFCVFPSFGSVFGQLIGWFTDDEIEILDETFTTEQAIIEMIDLARVSSPHQFEGHVCYLPDLGTCYIAKTWNNDCYHGTFTAEYAPAEYNAEKGGWVYRKGKKNLIRKHSISYSNVEDGKILQ